MAEIGISVLISDGEDAILISRDSEYRATRLDGFAFPSSFTVSEKTISDGELIHSKNLGGRRLNIEFEIVSPSDKEKRRRELISFLDPKKDFLITVERGDIKRKITACISKAEAEEKDIFGAVKIKLEFLAESALFSGEKKVTVGQMKTEPMMYFPLTFLPEGEGLTPGLSVKGTEFDILNRGDTETGFTLFMKARGAVINPVLTLGDKYLRLVDSLRPGDTYTISTVPHKKVLLKNGQSCYEFDRSSVFFGFPKGRSHLSVGAYSGASSLDISIEFEERYFGI